MILVMNNSSIIPSRNRWRNWNLECTSYDTYFFTDVNHVVQRHWHDGGILTAEDFVITNDLETNDVLWFFIVGHVQSMKS